MNKYLRSILIVGGAVFTAYYGRFLSSAITLSLASSDTSLSAILESPFLFRILDGTYGLLAMWYVVNRLFEKSVYQQTFVKKATVLTAAIISSLVLLAPFFLIQLAYYGLDTGGGPTLQETLYLVIPPIILFTITWTMMYNISSVISKIRQKNTQPAPTLSLLDPIVMFLTMVIIVSYWISFLNIFR